jgi:hypothetical protein
MTIFCFSERLAIRVGRDGLWICAPSLLAEPLHLDRRRLAEMGLELVAAGPEPSGGRRNALLPTSSPELPSRSAEANTPSPPARSSEVSRPSPPDGPSSGAGAG